jgi:GntR family transcriptional regulator
MLIIDFTSSVSIFEQVRLGVRRAIAGGQLKAGDSLPTVRQLAADLNVNLNTVARAYRELETEGLVSTVRGRGTIITATLERRREPQAHRRLRILAEIRNLLANARLAGMTRIEIQSLVGAEAGSVWQKKE